MAPRTAGPLRRALRSPFRRGQRAASDGLQLTPVPTPDLSRSEDAPAAATPDLLGDLTSRLDAARNRLRDRIPPQADLDRGPGKE